MAGDGVGDAVGEPGEPDDLYAALPSGLVDLDGSTLREKEVSRVCSARGWDTYLSSDKMCHTTIQVSVALRAKCFCSSPDLCRFAARVQWDDT